MFRHVTFKAVFERYFEQRFLDGLQRKAQAYSGKIGLILGQKPWRFPIFLKNATIFRIYVFYPQSFPRELATCAVIFQRGAI